MQKNHFTGSLQLADSAGWDRLSGIIGKPARILILTHKNPDGDAVGSALGLKWILDSLGHRASVAIPDDSPGFLKWLPGHEGILVADRKSGKTIPDEFAGCELIICVDFNSTERIGTLEQLFLECNKPSLLTDHHPVRERFTDLEIADPSKGSTSELIYAVIDKLGFSGHIGSEAATCLLAGIMTDTVGFRVSCSYPEVFEVVAALMRKGADKDRIYEEVYGMFSADRMRLLGYSLEKNMKVLPEYRTAYIALGNDELNSYRHRKGDTEGFVNYPLSIAGIVFSVLFTQQTDHIKLSLRSRGSFPANEFARKHFNGGGHLNAAGGKHYGTMAETLERFEKLLKDYAGQLNSAE